MRLACLFAGIIAGYLLSRIRVEGDILIEIGPRDETMILAEVVPSD